MYAAAAPAPPPPRPRPRCASTPSPTAPAPVVYSLADRETKSHSRRNRLQIRGHSVRYAKGARKFRKWSLEEWAKAQKTSPDLQAMLLGEAEEALLAAAPQPVTAAAPAAPASREKEVGRSHGGSAERKL